MRITSHCPAPISPVLPVSPRSSRLFRRNHRAALSASAMWQTCRRFSFHRQASCARNERWISNARQNCAKSVSFFLGRNSSVVKLSKQQPLLISEHLFITNMLLECQIYYLRKEIDFIINRQNFLIVRSKASERAIFPAGAATEKRESNGEAISAAAERSSATLSVSGEKLRTLIWVRSKGRKTL